MPPVYHSCHVRMPHKNITSVMFLKKVLRQLCWCRLTCEIAKTELTAGVEPPCPKRAICLYGERMFVGSYYPRPVCVGTKLCRNGSFVGITEAKSTAKIPSPRPECAIGFKRKAMIVPANNL